MPTLEELRNRFQRDRFAMEVLGAEIEEAGPGRARCGLALRPCHMNANGTPMGGVIFTLADFAFAVAANGFSDRVTVYELGTYVAHAVVNGFTVGPCAPAMKKEEKT